MPLYRRVVYRKGQRAHRLQEHVEPCVQTSVQIMHNQSAQSDADNVWALLHDFSVSGIS